MLRYVALFALAASAAATTTVAPTTTAAAAGTTGSTTLSCQTITITPASGSICSTASGSVCSTAAGATATQTALTASWSALTTATTTVSGTAACAAIGGTAVTSFWNSASTWGCNGKIPNPCDSATCGATLGTGTVVITTPQPYCCKSIRDYIASACTGVTAIDTAITPTGMGNGTSLIFSTLGLPSACSDSNCRTYTGNSASSVAYSVLAVLVAALLALVNF